MTDEPVNEATLELFERRISDKITEQVRNRLVAPIKWIAAGAIPILGIGGIGLIGWINFAIERGIEKISKEKFEKIESEIDKSRILSAEATFLLKYLSQKMNQITDNIDRTEAQLSVLQEKFVAIEELRLQMDKLKRDADLVRDALGRAKINTESLQIVHANLDVLSKQVEQIVRTGGTIAQAPAALQSIEGIIRQNETQRATLQNFEAAPNTVYIQFAGITRDEIDGLRNILSGREFRVPPAERTPAAIGKFEVRYFHAADKEAAERLATAATNAIRAALQNERRTAQAADLTTFRGTKPREGTLELWYGPTQ